MQRYLAALLLASLSAYAAEPVAVWEGPPPDLARLDYPAGIEHVRVHESNAAGDGWLLGAAVVVHDGEIFVSWANADRDENAAGTRMMGRRSTDGARTWSEPFVIAGPAHAPEGSHYAHGSLLSHEGRLLAFAPLEGRAQGKFRPGLRTRIFAYAPEDGSWSPLEASIDNFYPMDNPRRRADGRWTMGGIDRDSLPSVALSDSSDPLGGWRSLRIGAAPKGFETSIWVDGDAVTAFIRNYRSEGDAPPQVIALRSEGGRDWSASQAVEISRSGLPAVDSKIFAGALSSGQRYLVYNLPVGGNGWDRRALGIAVTAPGGTRFERAFLVRAFGETGPRAAGRYKEPGWQYPYAYEHAGNLYIAYARAKEDCELSVIPVASLAADAPAGEVSEQPPMMFTHHYAFRDPGKGSSWGQTALADMDGDGDPDFVTGLRDGDVLWFENPGTKRGWAKHILGERSPSDVGGAALDVDRDGRLDFVAGGVWYRNTGKPREEPFERHVFDAGLEGVHDIVTGDLDGDGRDDVVTMSDKNDLRWYGIPDDPASPWRPTRIYDAVHSGVALGDLDGDGDLDLVRSDLWLENRGGGDAWRAHRISEPWGDRSFPWSYNATQAAIADLNADGRLDIVLVDGEIRGARGAWFEAPADPRTGDWVRHDLEHGDAAKRGAYHSLAVADFDNDSDPDIFTAEMEHIAGDRPPRWFIWENVDGRGRFVERVVLDKNLGGHRAQVADIDGDGDLDICSKPWSPADSNNNGGRNHFDLLENLTLSR